MKTPQWPKETLDVYSKIQAHLRVIVTLDDEIGQAFKDLKSQFPLPLPEDEQTVKLTDDDMIQIICQHALGAPLWGAVMKKKDFSNNDPFIEAIDQFVKLVFRRKNES